MSSNLVLAVVLILRLKIRKRGQVNGLYDYKSKQASFCLPK